MSNNWMVEDDGSYRMFLSQQAGSFTIRVAEENEEFKPVMDLPNLSPIKEAVSSYVLRHNSNVLQINKDPVSLMEYADTFGKKLSRE